MTPINVVLLGPTSRSASDLAADVAPDLARLSRPGVAVTFRTTGAGPADVHRDDDARLAAPHVVAAVVAIAAEGADAVIVDCTADPGLEAARAAVAVPVVGAGEALRAAIGEAPEPVRLFSGDELRSLDETDLVAAAAGAATVALGGTGWSHRVRALRAAHPGLVVLDPLDLALDRCLAALEGRTSGPLALPHPLATCSDEPNRYAGGGKERP